MAKTRGAFVYEDRNSAFQRLHPTTRTVFILFVICTAFCIQHPVLLFLLYALTLVVAFSAKMSKKMLLVYFGLIGTGALISFITWLPFGSDVGGTVYYQSREFLGMSIAFSTTGFMWASTIGLRILISSLPIFLYISTTKLREMSIGFHSLGLPFTVCEMFTLAFRFVPLVQNDASTITEAQKARGLDFSEGGAMQKFRKYSAILTPMIFMSLRRIQSVSNALDTKAFRNSTSRHRFYKPPAYRTVDWVIIAACVVVFCLALTARFLGFMIIVPGRL